MQPGAVYTSATLAALISLETCPYFFFFKILFIYSWKTQREAETETQAEGEAGSMQGAWCGTQSRDSRIMPWAEDRHLTTEPPGIP